MKVNNSEYGGFVVSNNIIKGNAIAYSFREKSDIPELNGWTLYSIEDDEDYVSNPNNFQILSASSIMNIAPVILEIFNAPYGTDLFWQYEEGVHVGFYDLTKDEETDIYEILNEGR